MNFPPGFRAREAAAKARRDRQLVSDEVRAFRNAVLAGEVPPQEAPQEADQTSGEAETTEDTDKASDAAPETAQGHEDTPHEEGEGDAEPVKAKPFRKKHT